MNKSVFIWKNFHKCPELNYCFNFPFINLSDFRNSNNLFHPVECSIYNFSILTKNIDISMTINLFDNYGSASNTLYLLNYFSTRANQSSNQFLGNSKHFNPWSMWFKFRTRF